MSVLEDMANAMHNTAQGRVEWAKILQPDYKFDKDGLFTMDFYLDREPAQAVLEVIRPIVAMKAQQEGAKSYAAPPFTLDKDSGVHCFKYRQSAIGRPKNGEPFNISIDVFDARMNPWPRDVLIGNGSIIKVCFTLWPWNVSARGGVGVTLRPKAVQIINHVPYEPEEKTYGFQPQEGTDMGPQPFQKDLAGTEALSPYAAHTGGPVTDDIPF